MRSYPKVDLLYQEQLVKTTVLIIMSMGKKHLSKKLLRFCENVALILTIIASLFYR